MKLLHITFASTLLALLAMPASAALIATATIEASQISPSEYQYELTLNNVGTTTIGTFWFAWVPGINFMTATPTNITAPAGWTANTPLEAGSTDAGIQWLAGSNQLAAGGSLTGFSFQSTETPAELAGFASPPHQSFPVTTSFVYSGAPFSDAGYKFVAPVVSSVPLPGTLGLLTAGLMASGALLGRRQSAA